MVAAIDNTGICSPTGSVGIVATESTIWFQVSEGAHTYGATHTYWPSPKGGNGRVQLDRHVTSDPTDAVALTPDSPITCIPPGAHRDDIQPPDAFLPVLHPATTPTGSPLWVGRRRRVSNTWVFNS